MFNLLPPSLKTEIKREYGLRRLIIIFIFILGIQVSFLIFMLPTWLVSLYKERVISSEYQKISQNLSDLSISSTADKIKAINKKLSILENSIEYTGVIPYVDSILKEKTKSIYLDQFAYLSKGSNSAELTIGGVATTRETLVAFVDRLKESGVFSNVDLPISNLAKDKNIDFTVKLLIDQKK